MVICLNRMGDQELRNGLLEVFKTLIPLTNFIFYLTTGTICRLLPGDSMWGGTGGSTFMFYWQYLTKYSTLICMKQKCLHFYFTADRGKAALTSVKLWNIFLHSYLILITLMEYQGKNVFVLSSDSILKEGTPQKEIILIHLHDFDNLVPCFFPKLFYHDPRDRNTVFLYLSMCFLLPAHIPK